MIKEKNMGFTNTGWEASFDAKKDLTDDEQVLISLADDMAAAMSNMNSQNYKEFIEARDRLRSQIAVMVDKSRKSEERIVKIKAAVLAA